MCYPLALLYAPLRHHNIELNLHHKNIKVILFVFIFFFSRLVSFLHFGSITIGVATFFRSIPLAHFWHLCVRFEIACDACSHEKLLSEFAMIANAANLSSHSDCLRLFFIDVPFEFVCVFFVDFLHTQKTRAILFLQIKMHMFGWFIWAHVWTLDRERALTDIVSKSMGAYVCDWCMGVSVCESRAERVTVLSVSAHGTNAADYKRPNMKSQLQK